MYKLMRLSYKILLFPERLYHRDYINVFCVWLIYFRIFQVVIGSFQRTLFLTFYEDILRMSRSEMIFRLFLGQNQFHGREGLQNILGSFTRLLWHNYLKISGKAVGYLFRNTAVGHLSFCLIFKVKAPFVERNVRIERIKL